MQKLEEIQNIIRRQVISELEDKINSIKGDVSSLSSKVAVIELSKNQSNSKGYSDEENNTTNIVNQTPEESLFGDKDLEN
jgi:hypothetical protein